MPPEGLGPPEANSVNYDQVMLKQELEPQHEVDSHDELTLDAPVSGNAIASVTDSTSILDKSISPKSSVISKLMMSEILFMIRTPFYDHIQDTKAADQRLPSYPLSCSISKTSRYRASVRRILFYNLQVSPQTLFVMHR